MSLFEELKRRNVVRVAFGYVIIAWLLMQVGDTLGPALRLPEWIPSALAFFLILGFPVAMYLAWVYELTPDGIKPDSAADGKPDRPASSTRKLNQVIIFAVVLVVAFFAFDRFVLNENSQPGTQTAADLPAITTLQDGMAEPDSGTNAPHNSIAVLPFVNMSSDPEQEYFSDGITEDIITELSRFHSLFVIARNSSFAFKGQATGVTEIGKKLGVKFIVEGSVRRAGDRIRITAQLIEASTGNHLWAERYDRNLDDIFAVQDEVTAQIVTMVPGHVEIANRVQAERKPANDINAYDLFLRALNHLHRNFSSREGEQLLKQALEIDPAYSMPHAYLATFYSFSTFTHSLDISEATRLARFHAESALKLDPGNPVVQIVLAMSYLLVGEHALANHHMTKAIDLNPNEFLVKLFSAEVMAYLGDNETAVKWADKAAFNDPYSADTFREIYFDAHYLGGRYELALEHLIGWQNHPLHIHLAKAAAFAQLNRIEESHEALQQLEKKRPKDWSVTNVMNAYARMCAKPEDRERWLEGFRKAGLDI